MQENSTTTGADALKNWRECISADDVAQMSGFMRPLLETIGINIEENTSAAMSLETVEFEHGMVLYSRLLTNFAARNALTPIYGPLTHVFRLLKEGKIQQAANLLQQYEQLMLSVLDSGVAVAEDNIAITSEHLRQYCLEHNIDPITTPYS